MQIYEHLCQLHLERYAYTISRARACCQLANRCFGPFHIPREQDSGRGEDSERENFEREREGERERERKRGNGIKQHEHSNV